MKYREIDRVVSTYFSYNSGVDFDEWIRFFESDLTYLPFKERLKQEVVSSFNDMKFSWLSLLKRESIAFNEEITSEENARKWAKEELLDKYLT